ncbi:MAG: GlxA family transcriptional regulator [Pseudomonadota bacterium]
MTSFTAKSHTDCPDQRLVVFVIYENIVLLDLVGPLQVFSHAPDPKTEKTGYRCAIVSAGGDMTDTNTVLSVPSAPLSEYLDCAIDTLVIVGGDGANTAMNDQALIDNVTKLASGARRVCSVCSGALVLAATGLLDGRRAVTHWDDVKTLTDTFPNVRVELDPIYIKDGRFWTSAGITAGIDMALAIVAEDLGRAAALTVARSMVTQMVRSGGQSQYSPDLARQMLDKTGQFDALHHWIEGNLSSNLTIDRLADRSNMSTRNFSRVYSGAMGVTPAKAVEAMRIERARELLETTDLSVKSVATECGFHDEERMRRAFMRLLNVSPSSYRQTFSAR